MTITYRTAGAWGAGKGSNLTAAEVDGNFYDLDQRLDALEAAIPAPNEIASFNLSGSQLSVVMDDATIFQAGSLITARFNFRGDWTPSTAYAHLDVVRATGGTFVVFAPHTSGAVFNADELNVDDERLYNYLSLDAQLTHAVVDFPGTGEKLHTATLNQANAYFRFHTDAPADAEFKIPNNTTVAFPIGTEFTICQRGTQTVLVWVDSPDDLYGHPSSLFTTSGVGTVVVAKKISATEWELHGEYAV